MKKRKMCSRKGKQKQGHYEVGYGVPPEHSKFKPGQSGNPAGRSRKRMNMADAVTQCLDEEVEIVKNGKPKKVCVRDVVAFKTVEAAAKGNHKCFAAISKLDGSEGGHRVKPSASQESEEEAAERERRKTELVRQFVRMMDHLAHVKRRMSPEDAAYVFGHFEEEG